MDKEKLYKFFEGESTPEEKKEVKNWLDTSESHRNELFREREFYDALILSEDKDMVETHSKSKEQRSIARTMLVEISKIAAAIVLAVLVGSYLYNRKMEDILLATNTLVVPAGQRANIQLPDGTNVWLNARSEITYPAYFTGSTREIRLNGEAYFDVAHDKNKPFIVQTKAYEIEVLGTSFNVEAYADSNDFSTALMEGSVVVTDKEHRENQIKLVPNQQAMKIGGQLIAQSIEDYDIYRWKEGLICFKEANFLDLMKRFEKCYGIEIIVENPHLSDKVFGGKFRISDGIDSALRVLQKEGKYHFERNSDDSVIYIR